MLRSLLNPEFESIQSDSLSISGSLSADEATIGTVIDKSSGNKYDIDNDLAGGGGGVWSKDGDLSVSNVADGNAVYNPSTTYDQYLIIVHEWHGNTSNLTNWRIIANGDGSSTDTVFEDDTRSANNARVFRKDPTTQVLSGFAVVKGRWTSGWSGRLNLASDFAGQGIATQIGDKSLTSPLDSIEFDFADGQNITVEADILGRDIA